MFQAYVLPIIIVVAIGLVAGVVLVLAAKFMATTVDEKFELLRAQLPGANCGACGYAGCDDYAAKLVDGVAAVNLCTPGGEAVMRRISSTLGKQASTMVPRTAVVACSGTYGKAKQKMEYRGRSSCAAASLFYQGNLACDHGCLGFGDCAKICPFEAIYLEDGLAKVDKRRCTGCGKCSTVCPHRVIQMMPHAQQVYLACSSTDSGGTTRKNCSAGCIGCAKCAKVCPSKAIIMKNYLPVIDYKLCTNCGQCVASCPTKAIQSCLVRPAEPAATGTIAADPA